MTAAVAARSKRERTIELSVFSGRVVHERDQAVPEFGRDSSGNLGQTGIIRLRDYVIRNRDGVEDTLSLRNLPFDARPGNLVSLVYGLRGDTWLLLGVKNHDTGTAQMQPNALTAWFKAESVVPPFAIMAAVVGAMLSGMLAHIVQWLTFAMSVVAGVVVAYPVFRWAEPFHAEQQRVTSFVRDLERPVTEDEATLNDESRSLIYQQFNGPVYGGVIQNNVVQQSFPAEALRALLRDRSESAAVDTIEHELRSSKPVVSRILSAMEILRGVTDFYEVSRIATEWWSNPAVQSWITQLLVK